MQVQFTNNFPQLITFMFKSNNGESEQIGVNCNEWGGIDSSQTIDIHEGDSCWAVASGDFGEHESGDNFVFHEIDGDIVHYTLSIDWKGQPSFTCEGCS